MAIIVAYDLNGLSVEKAMDEVKLLTDGLASDLVDDALEQVEQAQILAYTISGRPPRLRYERTFRLKSSSRKVRTGPTSGRWYADESVAPYAQEVLGLRADQAEIHRDRWKSIEQVEQEVEAMLPALAERRQQRNG